MHYVLSTCVVARKLSGIGLGACPTTESRGAPNRHAIDPDGRDAHAHRYALPLLAANADAFVQLQIVAHHADVLQRFRSDADQRGVAHGARHAPAFDEIAFRGREDEIAAGDIYLAAAEIGAVEALGHRADDLLGIAFAGQHERVGHARHGDVRVALAAAAAGLRGAGEAARKLVLQIAAQDAVLDEHI